MSRPLPPPDLRYRVTGTEDADMFDRSGEMTVDLYGKVLGSGGLDLAGFADIFDFGCGPGRVLRWLADRVPGARLHGSDIDAPAVAWVVENLPGVDARVNAGLPPLPFDDGAFDLVLAYSVFTHIDEGYQDAWLAELYRVTRPGAALVVTIHGDVSWRHTLATSDHPRLGDLRALRPTLEERGIAFWSGDGWEQFFPDFYHTTFHLPEYVVRHWSRWFAVGPILVGDPPLHQDAVLLRRDRRQG